MTLGILSFSIATLLCGLSQSLDTLVLWRILQGATGAPVVPLSQTILLDTSSRAASTPWCCRSSAWRSAWPP